MEEDMELQKVFFEGFGYCHTAGRYLKFGVDTSQMLVDGMKCNKHPVCNLFHLQAFDEVAEHFFFTRR